MSRPSLALLSVVVVLLLSSAFPAPAAAQDLPGACRTISVNDSVARGNATALRVRETATNLNLAFGFVEGNQTGPGLTEKKGTQSQDIAVGNIVRARLLYTNTSSNVTLDPLASNQRTESEILGVNILNGLVQVDVARAVATANSTMSSANLTGQGSALGRVVIDGVAYVNVASNLRVPLPVVFGEGSHVSLYNRRDEGRFPGGGNPFYLANLTMQMVKVSIKDYLPLLPGNQTLEVIISEANAYAQTPTPFCGGEQGVGASAYVTRYKPDESSPSVYIGRVKIPVTGGSSNQTYADVQVPEGHEADGTVFIETAQSKANGYVRLGEKSRSQAIAKVENLCIGPDENGSDVGECTVTARAIRAESNSEATPTGAFSWGSVIILDLVVAGIDVCEFLNITTGQGEICRPPPNTKVVIDGITVTLNERQRDAPRLGHTGYIVRAVRVESDLLGEVTVGRAQSEADYR